MPDIKEFEMSKDSPVKVHVGDTIFWKSDGETMFGVVTGAPDGGLGQILIGPHMLLPVNLLPFPTTVLIECPHILPI